MAELRVRRNRLKLRAPLRMAWGELHVREILEVRLTFGPDDYGNGEAAPLEAYDGVSMAAVRAALDVYAEVVRRVPTTASHAEILAGCARERWLPQALAAIDLALWDRAGRKAGKPVAALLSAGWKKTVPVNATISGVDPIYAAAEAYRAASAGYRTVKVKVGLRGDAARVAAVRTAVGPDVAIRVDANGAWRNPQDALQNLRELVPAGIELAEEPVHGIEQLREVREHSPIPIGMDETAAEPGALEADAADVVCLKVSRCGGISGVLQQAQVARAAGAQVFVASSFDGPLGVAAGIHAAAVLETSGPLPACGLATLGMFEELAHVMPIDNGQVDVPAVPGILGMPPPPR